MAVWVVFNEHVCIDGKTVLAGCFDDNTLDEVKTYLTSKGYHHFGEKIISCKGLPYPAEPRLHKVAVDFGNGEAFTSPSFCWKPTECQGRGSCGSRYSCVE